MQKLLAFSDRLALFVEWIARKGSLLILLLIAIVMYDVVTRKFQFIQQAVLNSPLYAYISPVKLQEMEWHLHAVIFLLAFGFTYLKNGHVRVDLYRETLTKKRQAYIELFGLVVVAMPFILLVMYFGAGFVGTSFRVDEGSEAMTGIPNRWIVKSFFMIGLFVLMLAIWAQAMRLAIYLFTDGSLKAQALERLPMLVGPDSSDTPLDGGSLND